MKTAIISLNISAGDKESNINSLKESISTLPSDVDLIVLPELFSTGFTSNRDKLLDLSEENDDNTMVALKSLSKRHGFAVAGSFLAKTGDNIYNRAFFIEPSGDTVFYDKRHLFSISSESKTLSAGESKFPIVRFRGWNIAMSVCYDLRFPAWCRNTGNKYDLLLIPANWPDSRKYAWNHLLIARAIENQAYVLGANRSGEDKFGRYDNMSAAYDYYGQAINAVKTGSDINIYELNLPNLIKYREEFPVWKDADSYEFSNMSKKINPETQTL